jgi:hypothetical protein
MSLWLVCSGVLLALTSPLTIRADPARVESGSSVDTASSAPHHLGVVNRIGESEQQAALRDGKLSARRRSADPFGIAIRGKFKGLPPPEAMRPATTPGTAAASNQPAPGKPAQAQPASNEPTFSQAVQQLVIGGIDVGGREVLIGSRRVREGDLLVVEFSRHQFVVWVQGIDQRGVQFCDINLQQHTMKQIRSAPNELPGDSAGEIPDVRNFLNQNAPYTGWHLRSP